MSYERTYDRKLATKKGRDEMWRIKNEKGRRDKGGGGKRNLSDGCEY